MKKIIALAMAVIISTGVSACGAKTPATSPTTASSNTEGTVSPQSFKKFKIGIAEVQANDESVTRRNYLENYIAPKYNVEFIFSEQCTDSEKVLTFIENCADAGADAVISYLNDDIEQLTQVSQEYGMKYIVNTVRIQPKTEAAFAGGYENFAAFGSNQASIADLFNGWLLESASADGSEGFIICSGVANKGNLQHTEITRGTLEALQEKYGLTFKDELKTIITTSAPLEAVNDKGISIYVYPGSNTQEGWLQGLTAAIQTGRYATLLGAIQIYNLVGVVVDEAEASMNKNLKVASIAVVSETLRTSFNTKDRFGNPSVDMATAKPVSVLCAAGFAQAYNLLTGNESATLAPNGEAAELNTTLWAITDKDILDIVSKWDVSDKWIADYGIVDSMLGIYNSDLTNSDIQAVIDSMTYENTLKRLGK